MAAMAQFKTRESVAVDAVQLTWSSWSEVCELLQRRESLIAPAPEADKPVGVFVDRRSVAVVEDGNGRIGLQVPTSTGGWLAVEDDWIVLGPQGELSACKPALFARLFMPVAPTRSGPWDPRGHKDDGTDYG